MLHLADRLIDAPGVWIPEFTHEVQRFPALAGTRQSRFVRYTQCHNRLVSAHRLVIPHLNNTACFGSHPRPSS